MEKAISPLYVESLAIDASIALKLKKEDGIIKELGDIFDELAKIPEKMNKNNKKGIIILGRNDWPIIYFLGEVIQRYYDISARNLNCESISLKTREIATELKNQKKITKERRNYLSQFAMEVSRIANKHNGFPRVRECSYSVA